ncbi:MAG TPA: hypothetical protein VKR06_16885 [Ktedonosporobacter sp.]|nr:hypothetical protein [Ktedonosporobacter sp.]
MRQYLYTLQVYRAATDERNLFIIYAVDDIDAMKKAKRRVEDHRSVEMTLRRCEGHFTAGHREYPPYIDMEDGLVS